MTEIATVAAADLGASSGRVMLARVGRDLLDLSELHRFGNEPVRVGGTLHWDVLALYRGVLDGLRAAGRAAPGGLDGIGIDSWAVDYGLLDATGALIGNPVGYRDERTEGVMARVHAQLDPARLYAVTGLQNLPFNTIYQLVAARGTPAAAAAHRMLLMPDLLAYWLTGEQGAELTNASTTGLLDATTGDWSTELITALDLDRDLFAPVRQPGERIGTLRPDVAETTGLKPSVPVLAVGSHDTASAVVGVPADGDRFAYISCGTWSLVGLELPAPVLTEAGRQAGFTNEAGVDGTVRYLRNVMGLWLVQESLRVWSAQGRPDDLAALLDEAARQPAFVSVVDPDDPVFLPPGDMPARIADFCRRTGQPAPASPAALVRCIVESLALAHARTVRRARELADRDVEAVHLVGGGARNELLCQLTADACGLPVVAGPVEATALGNALVQARAIGAIDGSLADLRGLLRRHTPTRRYLPSTDPGPAAWTGLQARLYR
ncbi:carbohydrate kinase [Catellatospora methionotrophica]|uniref:Carbohydrate kinase n=1 Tax=Catellatospora methionotrophica TaxID=121620 RepID=A0A8J3PFY8_9ACTN|nr:rhamnulokinase family protein [Catellatospora methionotrophica]GIG14853.1 carbohydrate kinase [Catellatospora methionotrophica]